MHTRCFVDLSRLGSRLVLCQEKADKRQPRESSPREPPAPFAAAPKHYKKWTATELAMLEEAVEVGESTRTTVLS